MNWKQPKVYAVKHKSEDVRMDSRAFLQHYRIKYYQKMVWFTAVF